MIREPRGNPTQRLPERANEAPCVDAMVVDSDGLMGLFEPDDNGIPMLGARTLELASVREYGGPLVPAEHAEDGVHKSRTRLGNCGWGV